MRAFVEYFMKSTRPFAPAVVARLLLLPLVQWTAAPLAFALAVRRTDRGTLACQRHAR
jgi:hypothetical protein